MAPSAYFLFCSEHRASVKDRLSAAPPDEEGVPVKVSVTAVAKELGKLWKTLTEEQRQEYKERAVAQGEAQQQAAQQQAAAGGGSDAAPMAVDDEAEPGDKPEGGGGPPARDMLPLSIVKRIILCDPDVSRISRDAQVALAQAAELFLQLLATRGAAAARAGKRRTMRLDDFETVVKQDRRLVATGLRDVAAATKAVAQEAAAAREAAAEQEAKENADPAADAGGSGEKAGHRGDAEDAGAGGGAQAGGAKGGGARRGRPPAAPKAKPAPPQGPRITSFFRRAAPAAAALPAAAGGEAASQD